MNRIEMVIDSVRTELLYYQCVVLLKDKSEQRYLPIYLRKADGEEIRNLSEGKEAADPSYFDYLSLSVTAPAKPASIVIDRLDGSIFRSKVEYLQDSNLRGFDCSAAKAIALALKEKVPIYVEESILDKVSVRLEN